MEGSVQNFETSFLLIIIQQSIKEIPNQTFKNTWSHSFESHCLKHKGKSKILWQLPVDLKLWHGVSSHEVSILVHAKKGKSPTMTAFFHYFCIESTSQWISWQFLCKYNKRFIVFLGKILFRITNSQPCWSFQFVVAVDFFNCSSFSVIYQKQFCCWNKPVFVGGNFDKN